MGNPVPLTEEQKVLLEELKQLDAKIWRSIKDRDKRLSYEEQEKTYEKMANIAHNLHMSLKESGHEPKHHKYMIENRGVPVNSVDFYNHIHPVDDLLKFISDENANDDPEDTTIDQKFSLEIYSRRWGHYDTYFLTRTREGWNFQGLMISNSGECDKRVAPCLYDSLRHDSVCYPAQIADFFEYLWEQAAEGLTFDEVQDCIKMIGEWISNCEMNTPRGIFRSYI